jgi:dihydropteroate synthase
MRPDGRTMPAAPGERVWDIGAGRALSAVRRPLVMGIVNLTPDSFHPASRRPAAGDAVSTALAQFASGADLVDLGAESTRPGSRPVPPDEEQARLLPALRALRRRTDAPVSVDTRHADTARRALELGADVINDVSAGRDDPGMLPLAARAGCGLVLMHMRGDPASMQRNPRYDDVVAEVGAFLADRAAAAEAAGVAPARIAVDPGIGFGKTLDHNLRLLAELRRVAGTRPLLVGASRKRFIEFLTGAPVEDRLPGSLAALAAARWAGAAVVRVHDVAASVQFLDTLAAIESATAAHG